MTIEATTPITFEKATKTKRKARIALVGYEGAGKTYTALVLGTALAEHDKKRCALADSEGDSALIYADRFDFDHTRLIDHSPSNYEAVLRSAIAADYGCLIYDSMSHEWIGAGGALEMKDRLSERSSDANSFTAWGKVTPAHNKVFAGVVNAPIHVVATMRQKKAYVVEQNDKGKSVPRLIGTEAVQREGAEYEFDLILNFDRDGIVATVAKSRYVGIEQGIRYTKPGPELAALIIAALDEGAEPPAFVPTAMRTEDVAAIVALGTASTKEMRDKFYDEYLPSLGFDDADVKARWSRFVRTGGSFAIAALTWWREQTIDAIAKTVGEPQPTLMTTDSLS